MKNLKSLFATRKKVIITTMCIIIILIIFGAGIAYATSTIAESTSIGAENAKNFAFADAGVDPVTAQNVVAEFDFENGQFVYEVEFTADDTEYDYLIKASDGTVLKKEMQIIYLPDATSSENTDTNTTNSDTEQNTANSNTNTNSSSNSSKSNKSSSSSSSSSSSNSSKSSSSSSSSNSSKSSSNSSSSNSSKSSSSSSSSNNSNSSSSSSSTSSMISLATAKNKALADANVSSSAVTYTKAKLDYDDGVAVYDIEFYTSTYEYEYEINAYTGAVYEKSVEAIKSTSSSTSTSSSSYIGVDKAKSIAVNKVGFSVSEVTFKKAKLEEDDGIYVYEIEFYKNGVEYEFTINASTGNIIEYEID